MATHDSREFQRRGGGSSGGRVTNKMASGAYSPVTYLWFKMTVRMIVVVVLPVKNSNVL